MKSKTKQNRIDMNNRGSNTKSSKVTPWWLALLLVAPLVCSADYPKGYKGLPSYALPSVAMANATL